MGREEDEARRRAYDDAEEERHFWESIEDDKRAEVEREAERREAAIEAMEKWFFEQFEDPANETPRDSEEQEYVFPWGGPFEAPDVLHGQFGADYEQSLIDEAIERIERDGITEWAPTSTGDYYEPPEPDPEDVPETLAPTALLTARILDRLTTLEQGLASLPGLPGNIGHNAPPDLVGLPPYDEEDIAGLSRTIAETRAELALPAPEPRKLATFARRFEGWGAKIGAYLAKKGDLMVDELIKNSMKALPWGLALTLFHDLRNDLLELAKHFFAAL